MSQTQLMAILNVTPDSFFEGSCAFNIEQALSKALAMENDGADCIDIGGESTRPGATFVSEEEELARIIPVIKELKHKISIPLSIDTYKPTVARAAAQAGVSLLNDITGFEKIDMVNVAKDYDTEICVMHMQGTPQTMQIKPDYPAGIIPFLLEWFDRKIAMLIAQGINPAKIIIDPGIGFGKTIADNLEIIHNLSRFKSMGFRVLLGLSRKTFLRKILNKPTEELLAATLAMNTVALNAGIDIIRVHDVKEHRDLIDVMQAYKEIQKYK